MLTAQSLLEPALLSLPCSLVVALDDRRLLRHRRRYYSHETPPPHHERPQPPPDRYSLVPLRLSPEEAQLLDYLTSATANAPRGPLTLRVAGGWVRNKLLGLPSDDLDVVADTLSGVEVVKLVCAQQQQQGLSPARFVVIAQNPDQSKHLETTTLQLFGRQVDVNQLRSDSYAADSRIPQVTGRREGGRDEGL